MKRSPEHVWQLMVRGSNQLAEELGLEAPPDIFTPTRALPAVDAWVAAHDAPLDEEEAAMLGFFLARVLIETHEGGLTEIRRPEHALVNEWTVTGFERGLAPDYNVPFVVSGVRIGVDRNLTAVEWYRQCVEEGAE